MTQQTSKLTYRDVDADILAGLTPPQPLYYLVVLLLAGGMGFMVLCWIYQIHYGMGVAGISHPTGWGVYIANFVFWVGIGHAGTLISAILHLVRSRWRTAVSRAAEAMTIFAVMTAGLFPLFHLGRIWVLWYILPYPSQRQLWPNFISPLVWDVLAVSTYLIVSIIFFYVGLLPDLAAARDRLTVEYGPQNLRARFYRKLALGWMGTSRQWQNHGRAYLYFAALATPLVISVHSVVSWDFAMSLLPGWHTTLFAPYFVAGAIHSGLAAVLILLIPIRKLFHLERVISINQFDALAQTMIVTGLVMGYSYVVEPFTSWYSGDIFERQFLIWRATGYWAVGYWLLWPLNVIAPLLLLFRAVRRSYTALFVIAVLVLTGMWLERAVIVPSAMSHDFLPHNWGNYFPTWVEISIGLGSACFFSFFFFLFTKIFPVVAMADVKTEVAEEQLKHIKVQLPIQTASTPQISTIHQFRVAWQRLRGHVLARDKDMAAKTLPSHPENARGLLVIFKKPDVMLHALEKIRDTYSFPLETYSPARLVQAEGLLNLAVSKVRYWTLFGAISGLIGGFALAIGSALVNGLIVGGKHPVSLIPYCIPGFEGTILLGSIFTLIGMIRHSPLGRTRLPANHDPRFSLDHFGLFIACPADQVESIKNTLSPFGPEETHVIQ